MLKTLSAVRAPLRAVITPLRFIPASLFSTVSAESSVSVVRHPYFMADGKVITAASDPTDRFAVVDFSGTQFKLAVDDVFVAHKMEGIDIGDTVFLDKVLLLGSKHGTIVGRPLVNGARVKTSVEEIAKDKKVIIFKMRRRKNSKRLRGFRRQVTILRVTGIEEPEAAKDIL